MLLAVSLYGGIRAGQPCRHTAAAAVIVVISKPYLLHWVLLATVDIVQLLIVAWHPGCEGFCLNNTVLNKPDSLFFDPVFMLV